MTQFMPQVEAAGGTQIGGSYINTWINCPRDWYNLHYRPYLGNDGSVVGTGLSAFSTSIPLLVGRVFHEAIAAWYESGVRNGEDTGERSVDKALEVALREHKSCESQFPADRKTGLESSEVAANEFAKVEMMLRAYHDRYGPESMNPEFPTIQVLVDDEGKPLVEREWTAQLCPGYVFTCRTDLIILEHGLMKTMEHKTTSAYGVQMRKREMDMDPQFSGEYWILRECLPQHTLAGVMVNMIVKDRSGKSKFDIAERETTTRTDGQLNRWRLTSVHALEQIDAAVARYTELLAAGTTHEAAADLCFPDYGTRTKQCYAFNSRCQFLDLCQMAGMEHKRIAQFKPRFTTPTLETT